MDAARPGDKDIVETCNMNTYCNDDYAGACTIARLGRIDTFPLWEDVSHVPAPPR
jgi:hypothetical protein